MNSTLQPSVNPLSGNHPVKVQTMNHGMLAIRELAIPIAAIAMASHLKLNGYMSPSEEALGELKKNFPLELGRFLALSFEESDVQSKTSVPVFWTDAKECSREMLAPTQIIHAGTWIVIALGQN